MTLTEVFRYQSEANWSVLLLIRKPIDSILRFIKTMNNLIKFSNSNEEIIQVCYSRIRFSQINSKHLIKPNHLTFIQGNPSTLIMNHHKAITSTKSVLNSSSSLDPLLQSCFIELMFKEPTFDKFLSMYRA